MRRLRNFFVAGLIVLIPLVSTIFFLRVLFSFVDGILQPILSPLIGAHIPGLGVISTLVLVILTGLLATNYLGSQVIHAAEALLSRTPIVKSIYGTSKQLVDAFFHPESTPFKQVCLVEYPRKGMYSVGFVTGEIPKDDGDAGEDLINIFVAATPNPTFGFYIIVPKSDVVYLDIGIDEGLKLVVSGGILLPSKCRAMFPRATRDEGTREPHEASKE